MTKMRDSMPYVFAGLAAVFLLMIIFQWGGQGTIFEPKGENGVLGTVNGMPITQKMYDKIYEDVTAQMKEKNKGAELTDAQENTARGQAWDQAVTQVLTDASISQMGIRVTDQEVRDMLFNNPPQQIRQQFTDSTGRFHEDQYIQALRDPRNDSIVRSLEATTREQLRTMLWQQTMAGTVRVTDTEAYIRYMTDSAKAMLQVVRIMAPQVTPQAAAQVPPSEIQAYYDSHKWMFPQEELRKFKFVPFPLVPNARDTSVVMETAHSIAARLTSAPLDQVDTVAKNLALDYSDLPYQPRMVVTMQQIGRDTSLLSSKVGDVVVANINGQITVARVLQIFDTGRTFFHIRHITVGYPSMQMAPTQQQKDSTLAAAQQLLAQLQQPGSNFAEAARTRSADPRTATTGGDMGWIDTVMLPPAFRGPLAKSPDSTLLGPLESPRGYDIMEVLGKSQRAWGVVGVPLSVKASTQTLDIEKQSANIFRDNAEKNGFDQAAGAANYHVVTDAPPVSRKGEPIFSSYEFVDWCYESKKGDISPAFDLSSAHAIIVAQLTSIVPAGPKPLDEVKEQIAQTLALRKAVAALATRAQQVKAAVGASGDLSAAAQSLGDPSLAPLTTVMGPAESVNGLPTGEYVINNWAYSAQPGTVSPVLKGEHGYYVAKLVGRTIPSRQDFERAKPAIVRQMTQEKEQRLLMEWVATQKQNATIEDYRFKH